MDRVCLVVGNGQEDKSALKLVEQIRNLGMDCTQAVYATKGTFAVGWGRSGRIPGLNCERPHNKLWEMERLSAAGVPVVPFDIAFDAAVRRAWNDLRSRGKRAIIFGRHKIHKQGTDILEFNLVEETIEKQLTVVRPVKRDFWTQVVPRAAEYRVHAFCGRTDRSATKVPVSEEARALLRWNQGTCTFDYTLPAPTAAKEAAVAAVKAYGLDFGAVDVIEDAEGACYVLEVNLRPGLNEDMVVYYATRIVEAAKAAIP